nr:reverse transcriptase domain-containing protein [Tanacetum cinerariifolium]
MANLTDMMSKIVSYNAASSSGSGTLPSNTTTNPKEELKGITTRSGVAYQGPINSTPLKQRTEVTKDQVQTPSSQSTTPVQPSVAQSETPNLISKPVVSPVSAPMPNVKSSIPYPLRHDNERRRDQANEQIEKFCEIFKDMSFKISFTDALILMPKFASTLKALIGNKEKLSEMARTPMNEHCSAEILGFFDVTASGNPTSHDDPIVSTTSPTLTPFRDSDFLLFEEADAFIGLEDDPNLPKINPFYYDPEGDILLLEAILNSEPLPSLPNQEQYLPSFKKELKVCEAKTVKSSVNEPLEVELKDLPPHLEYVFLEGDNKLPVIIAKELGDEEKSALIKVLKSHKRAIACKLSDIQATHKDHFHLLFMDQMLERLAGNEFYCFLDGFFGYFQIPIDPRDQKKQRSPVPTECLSIDACLSTMEVFMDDFSILGNSFENCISRLDKMLQRAKVDVIVKLPHPTTVKGAVLGQRHEKHFKPIHYASKMMDDVESNYTTKEKEMLAVVGMRCLKIQCKFVKFLSFGALIIWARSRLHEGTNIFSWLSITCQNGLKRKRSPPTTPVLFSNSLNLSSPDLVPLELS